MRKSRIYTSSALQCGADLILEAETSRYLSRVLRLGAGDEVTLFNGTGGEYLASISEVQKKLVRVAIGKYDRVERESQLRLHLAVAISRGDRFDWVIQKATELGAASIWPLFTERTGVKLEGERADKKLTHWRQVAISACEQCGRNRLPEIAAPLNLPTWIAQSEADLKLVLHHRAGAGLGKKEAPGSVALLVGPEGGLSDSEISLAEQADYQPLRMGPRILRTETAPLAALTLLQSHWGDMSI